MGVCCIVFDIDGMLFDFLYEFFLNFMFSSRFMLKKIVSKKIFGGGGGVEFLLLFF